MAITKTMMPIPPSQWVKERQKRIDFGIDSISVRIEAPVVLKPEQDSNTASARSGIDPEIINGAAPAREHTSHVRDTTKNPSLDLNFSGEGLMIIRISTPTRKQKPITVPNPMTDDFSM